MKTQTKPISKFGWAAIVAVALLLIALQYNNAPRCSELKGRIDSANGALLASCK